MVQHCTACCCKAANSPARFSGRGSPAGTAPERPLFNDAPSGGSSVVTTDEGNIPGMGSQHETSATQPFGAATDGSFKMELHGADATVSIGGTELKVENGKLYHNGVEVTADAAVSVPGGAHGTLTVTGMDADGTVHYTYTLTTPVDATGNASNRPGEGDAGRGEAHIAVLSSACIRLLLFMVASPFSF